MRLVVIDRDGVVNRDSPDFIRSPEEWEALPGSIEAIAALTAAGFDVVVASNQSGVGRGLFTGRTLEAINAKMTRCVEAAGGRLAGIFVCPHAPADDCDCRKPRPGLLRRIEADKGVSLRHVPVIGDSARDLDAARAVGATPVLVLTGNGERTLRDCAQPRSLLVFPDLRAAASALIDAVG